MHTLQKRGVSMKNYNIPPTEEFEMLTNHFGSNFNTWFTLQKAVMNDYWFNIREDPEYRAHELDHLFHKLYYCWMMMGKDLFDKEENEST